jgi:hypothetical protein
VNFNVFICWIFDPKVFYNCSSFSQSSVSWSLVVPSSVTTLILRFGFLFQQLRPCWQRPYPFSVLHGRLCLGTSFVWLIYVGNHRSPSLVNYIRSNNR